MTLWCILSGARVFGISNSYVSEPSHFKNLNLKKNMKNYNVDIRNLKKLKKVFTKIQPDYVFHLAAQSLVKRSFEKPLETFSSNTIGTLNILNALLILKKDAMLYKTSDKSYKNWNNRGYKEDDCRG